MTPTAVGTGTPQDPWQLTTPPGSSEFTAYRHPRSTRRPLSFRSVKRNFATTSACRALTWGRSAENPVGGWYGIKKGLRGRFATYIPPILETLGLAEVEHNPRNNRMRAITI